MKKYIPLMVVSLLVASFAVWFIVSPPNRFTATLAMESDAMSVVNYYYPNRIELQKQPVEAGLKLPPFISPEPKFGVLVIGQSADSLITIVLDESPGDSVNLLYVDKNNNGDLTDDGDPNWDDDKGDYWIKEALVDVNYGNAQDKAPVPYPISFYRYKNRLPNSIMAFRNGYRKGFITLKDSTYKIALFDDDANGLFNEFDKGAIVIDLNQDGDLNGHTDSPEYFSLSASFNIHGLAYKVEDVSPSGDRITFAVVDTIVFPKTVLEPGVRAPRFRIRDIQGQVVDLADYRNKVVLLDFWATWCRPWEEN